MAADNSAAIISFGGGSAAPLGRVVENAGAVALSLGFKVRATEAARELASMMPGARTLWAHGPQDWDLRGHAVVSVALLMGSAANVIMQELGLQDVAFSCTEATASLWPRLFMATDRIAVSVAAGAPPEVQSAVSRMLQSVSIRQAMRSLDENNTIVVDARSQVVLLEAGLIRSQGSSQGTVWQLTQEPISADALLKLKPWYSQTLRCALDHLRTMTDEVGATDGVERAVALFAACGAMAREIPVTEAASGHQSGLISLVGRLLAGGRARAPGTVLWADPWRVWDTCRLLATSVE